MITQANDTVYFDQKTRQIRAQVSTVLTKWGLLPRFKRWRLTQDPGTGMIVLFGILNNSYIATHSSIPFSDYFDPRLLHDLADELQLQVVSCNCEGLRYAFILERGSIVMLPSHIDYPFVDGDKVFVRVVLDNQPAPVWLIPPATPVVPTHVDIVGDPAQLKQAVVALVKIMDDKELKGQTASKLSDQGPPDVISIDEEEFKKRVAEHRIIWQKSHPD